MKRLKSFLHRKPSLAKMLCCTGLFLLATVATAVVMKYCSHTSPKSPADPAFPSEVYGVPVYTELMSTDIAARTGIKREIRCIVIHETDNENVGSDAKSHSAYLNRGISGETSWHYTVDDHEIYHHIPDDEVAWHAGDSNNPDGGNAHGIGIELCVNADGDYEQTLQNGAKLTAYLLKTYGLDITAVTQHADYMEKNCPARLRDSGRWDEFLQMVERYLKQ